MEISLEKTLQKYPSTYYTRQNLSLIMGSNRRTMDARISTLIKKEILLPLKGGFYLNLSMLSASSNPTSFLEYIGSLLVIPSYISLEYALFLYGFLAENVTTLTYVTTKKTRLFETKLARFSYRTINQKMFSNFRIVQYNKLSYSLATIAKAIFDLIYLTPINSKSNMIKFLTESRFNWDRLNSSDKNELSTLLTQFNSPKLNLANDILKSRGLI